MPTDALSQAVVDMVEGVANDILRALVDVTYGEVKCDYCSRFLLDVMMDRVHKGSNK